MPKIKPCELSIPAFYRRSALDLLLFAHVTAMHERKGMNLDDAIYDFFDLYRINEDDYRIESALVTYNRIRNNFIYVKIKEKSDDK